MQRRKSRNEPIWTTLRTLVLTSSILLFPIVAAASEDTADMQASYVDRVAVETVNLALGRYLSQQCSTCHSDVSGSSIPTLRGLPAKYFIGAVFEYREGIRANDVMKSVASGLTDEDVAALAFYYEDLAQR